VACTHLPDEDRRATGKIYSDLKNEQIVQGLKAHLKKVPTDIDARYELVKIFWSEYFFDDAIEQLQEIVKTDPGDKKAYELLAFTLVKSPRNDFEGSARVLTVATKKFPKRAELWSQLALAFVDLNRNGEAIRACAEGLGVAQTDSEKGILYLIWSTVDPERSKEHYQKAIHFDPSLKNQSIRLTTLPTYVGESPLFRPEDHPSWVERLKHLDSLGRE